MYIYIYIYLVSHNYGTYRIVSTIRLSKLTLQSYNITNECTFVKLIFWFLPEGSKHVEDILK